MMKPMKDVTEVTNTTIEDMPRSPLLPSLLLAAESSRVGSHQQVHHYSIHHDANDASWEGDELHYDAYGM